jgi:hypothetical protein
MKFYEDPDNWPSQSEIADDPILNGEAEREIKMSMSRFPLRDDDPPRLELTGERFDKIGNRIGRRAATFNIDAGDPVFNRWDRH